MSKKDNITGEVIEQKDEKPKAVAAPIPVSNETKSLAFTNHSELMAFIRQMLVAKAVPKHLENAEQVLSAWNFAAQLMLPPQPSLRNIAVIEGVPSLFGDLPLALAQRHEDFVYYEEFCIDKDYNKICFENKNLNAELFGGVVYLQRRGMEKPQSFSFTWADAEKAGIAKLKTRNGNETVWAKYPKDMIIRKARIRALRALFADALSGAGIAEDFGFAPDLKDVTPTTDAQNRASQLNSRFNDGLGEDVIEVARNVKGEFTSESATL